MGKVKTKQSYILDFFKQHSNQTFKLQDISQAVQEEYSKDYPDSNIYSNRSIRDLAKRGYIEELGGYINKPQRGEYQLIKGKKPKIPRSPFSQKTKEKILKRDNYKCQMCGIPDSKGNPIAVDHLLAEDNGGEGIVENGITLCTQCNNTKSNLDVTSFGKKVFKQYLKISKDKNDQPTIDFLEELLDVFNRNDRN